MTVNSRILGFSLLITLGLGIRCDAAIIANNLFLSGTAHIGNGEDFQSYNSPTNPTTLGPQSAIVNTDRGEASQYFSTNWVSGTSDAFFRIQTSHATSPQLAFDIFNFQSTEGDFSFTVDTPTYYAISGFYDTTFGATRRVQQFASLEQAGVGTIFSYVDVDEFDLGDDMDTVIGAASNGSILTGNTAGLLNPGTYHFHFADHSGNTPSGGPAFAARGVGEFNLVLSSTPAAVPEPATFALLSAGLLGSLIVRRASRKPLVQQLLEPSPT